MTTIQITLKPEQLKDLFSGDEGMKQLTEGVLNEVLEAQMTEHIGVEPYERGESRKTQRNGYRTRQIFSRVGPLTLRVPQARDGSFKTDLFRRYQRSEQALVLAMMEMVIQGVSTRKVASVTEELCGVTFSKSTVSDLCLDLDIQVTGWNERPLGGRRYPFVIVDALRIKVRKGTVQAMSALVVIGINEEGHREVLGIRLGDSESEATWQEMFVWLKERGLTGVDLVVSDDHAGLVKAVERHFQGASWQRCQVHLMRNVLCLTPKQHQGRMIAGMKKIFGAGDAQEARRAFDTLCEEMAVKAGKGLEILENGLEDAIGILALPEKYRVRLRSTNMLERLNEELRRRERVIRIFPNERSAVRMIGSLLAEQHEEWLTGKRYFEMAEYWEWRAQAKEKSEERHLKVVG